MSSVQPTSIAEPSRRWFRYSLRTLLLVVTVFCLWLGMQVERANRQRAAIAALEAVDGYFYYDYAYEPPKTYYRDAVPPGPGWCRRVIDQNLVFDVVAVGLNTKPATDDTLKQVAKLRHLQQLDVAAASKVTDEGLKHLIGLKRLTYLRLDGTSVTESAVDEFRRMHPKTELVWWPEEE